MEVATKKVLFEDNLYLIANYVLKTLLLKTSPQGFTRG